MRTPRRRRLRPLSVLATLSLLASTAALSVFASAAGAAPVDVYICARDAVASIADPTTGGTTNVTVNYSGFTQVNSAADCATAVVSLGDPTPVVLSQNTAYTVHLVNQTSMTINFTAVGLTGAPDFTGVAPGGSSTYDIAPTQPGTYLYESDYDPRHTLLGLAGVIVVTPPVAGSAHGTAVSAFDVEQIVLLNEIDTALMNAPDPLTFDMNTYSPDLFLVNGQSRTDASAPAPVAVGQGERLLLRYINAGSANITMTVLGLRQSVVAFDDEIFDGSGAPGETPGDQSAVFVSAGQTADVIVVPDGAAGDTYPVYNRNLRTSAVGTNGAQMLMVEVTSAAPAPAPTVYFSLNNSYRILLGTMVYDEDIAVYDGTGVSVYFQGAAHGLVDTTTDLADIDAVHVDPASGDLWFSLRQDYPNPGTPEWSTVPDAVLQDVDVFHWDGTRFTVWLDGSAIGLSDNSNRHDINGVSVDPVTGITTFSTNGRIRISDFVPSGTGSSTIIGWENEDIMRWVPVFGAASPSGPGAFEAVFDGTDFDMAPENLDSVVINGNDVSFSTVTSFPDLAPIFGNDLLVRCAGHQPPASGSVLDTCAAPFDVEFDAGILQASGYAGQVDAYSLG